MYVYNTPAQDAADAKVERIIDKINEYYWLAWAVDPDLPIVQDFYDRYVLAREMLTRRGYDVCSVDDNDGRPMFVAVEKEFWNSDRLLPVDSNERIVKAESDRYFDADGNFDVQRYYNDGFQKVTWKDDES